MTPGKTTKITMKSCGTEMSCSHTTNKMKTATFYDDDKNHSLFNIIITNITTSL